MYHGTLDLRLEEWTWIGRSLFDPNVREFGSFEINRTIEWIANCRNADEKTKSFRWLTPHEHTDKTNWIFQCRRGSFEQFKRYDDSESIRRIERSKL